MNKQEKTAVKLLSTVNRCYDRCRLESLCRIKLTRNPESLRLWYKKDLILIHNNTNYSLTKSTDLSITYWLSKPPLSSVFFIATRKSEGDGAILILDSDSALIHTWECKVVYLSEEKLFLGRWNTKKLGLEDCTPCIFERPIWILLMQILHHPNDYREL